MDALDLPLDALLDLIYYWLTRNAEEDDVAKIDAQLWLPPKKAKVADDSPWSDKATRASLEQFAGPGGWDPYAPGTEGVGD